MCVLDVPAFTVPFSSQADSSVRTDVVPTARIGRPSFFAWLIFSAVSLETVKTSSCILWSSIFSSRTGRNVPSPTCSVTKLLSMDFSERRASISSVKWSPAVGQAALPVSFA